MVVAAGVRDTKTERHLVEKAPVTEVIANVKEKFVFTDPQLGSSQHWRIRAAVLIGEQCLQQLACRSIAQFNGHSGRRQTASKIKHVRAKFAAHSVTRSARRNCPILSISRKAVSRSV